MTPAQRAFSHLWRPKVGDHVRLVVDLSAASYCPQRLGAEAFVRFVAPVDDEFSTFDQSTIVVSWVWAGGVAQGEHVYPRYFFEPA